MLAAERFLPVLMSCEYLFCRQMHFSPGVVFTGQMPLSREDALSQLEGSFRCRGVERPPPNGCSLPSSRQECLACWCSETRCIGWSWQSRNFCVVSKGYLHRSCDVHFQPGRRVGLLEMPRQFHKQGSTLGRRVQLCECRAANGICISRLMDTVVAHAAVSLIVVYLSR